MTSTRARGHCWCSRTASNLAEVLNLLHFTHQVRCVRATTPHSPCTRRPRDMTSLNASLRSHILFGTMHAYAHVFCCLLASAMLSQASSCSLKKGMPCVDTTCIRLTLVATSPHVDVTIAPAMFGMHNAVRTVRVHMYRRLACAPSDRHLHKHRSRTSDFRVHWAEVVIRPIMVSARFCGSLVQTSPVLIVTLALS